MKRLFIPLLFLSVSAFGQFTKPQLYTNINTNIRLKTASQLRIAAVLDSIVKSMATGSSMVYPGAGIAVSTGSAWGTSITDNSANWNAAFSRTYSNGLTLSGGAVKLGGALTQNVVSDGAFDYYLGQTTPLLKFRVTASDDITLNAIDGADLSNLLISPVGLNYQAFNIAGSSKTLNVGPESVSIQDGSSGAGFSLDSLNTYIYGGTGGLYNGSILMSAPKSIKGDADTVRFTYPNQDYVNPDLKFEMGNLSLEDYEAEQIKLETYSTAGLNSFLHVGNDPLVKGGFISMGNYSGGSISMDTTALDFQFPAFDVDGAGYMFMGRSAYDVLIGSQTSTTDSYFNFLNSGVTYTDGKVTKDGIKYAASGYETDALTLTSRIYVTDGSFGFNNKTIQLSSNTLSGTKAQFNTAATDGDFLYVGDAPTAHTLDSHSNVTITANSSGELLKWNGSAWINNTLAEAGIQPAGSYLTLEVDGSISNEGSLTVAAGSGTTSIIGSNTSGSTDVTLTAGTGLSISEAGNVITLANTGIITEVDGSVSNELQTITNSSDATSHTVTLSNSGGTVQLIEGSNITLTTGGTGSAGTVTIASSGGFTDPMTTRGDIIIRNSSNVTARLPVGTSTYVLTSDGTDVSWAAPTGGSGLTYAQVKAMKFK